VTGFGLYHHAARALVALVVFVGVYCVTTGVPMLVHNARLGRPAESV
jgi:uncharacterized membrane protein HdeD (DUF308 family)